MRVVFNRQSTLGARTGIGHYAAELLRALQAQAGADQIMAYPTGPLWRLHRGFAGGPRSFAVSAGNSRAPRGPLATIAMARRAFSAQTVRGLLRALQPLKFRHFQWVCQRERFDLYHEPNILPMPCDRPTIATLHDLSAIAHPEWHPADRLKQFQKHLHAHWPKALTS